MIRVATLDRQPAVRAGVDAILRAQPDLTPAGSAAGAQELWPVLHRARPDVVLLDHDARAGGLVVCRRVKAGLLSPRVVVCAADPGTELVVPATLAGADAIVDKAADLRELLHAIRAVAAGERLLPRFTTRLQAEAAARLGHRDRAIFAMSLAGTTPRDIAATIGLSPGDLDGRIAAILATLGSRRRDVEPRDPASLELLADATGAPA